MTGMSRLLESRRSRLGRWAGAAAIVCVLHVGGAALALMNWHTEDEADEAAGALTVHLAPLPTVARVDSSEVPYGPEQQEARLAPQASKQVVEKVEKDVSRVDPSLAPRPELVLPKPQSEEKETSEKKARDVVPDKERLQQDRDTPATAPPRVDAVPAPGSAPSPRQSASLAREEARWQKAVVRRIERYNRGRYPAELERRGVKGVVTVKFRVDRSGRVVSAEVAKSSGWPVLDEAALANIRRASPLPVPPDHIEDRFLEVFMQTGLGVKPDQ